MLKKITCDKFKTQPQEFRKGLNVVLGSSSGSNAIGKSTFLLILDFAFGGDDYTRTAKDVFERIGHHQINIEFEFDGEPYFFTRATNKPTMINRCDSTYHVVTKEMNINDYRDLLFHEYKILLPKIPFKEMVGRFFRIYGLGNHNEHKPPQGDTMVLAVEYLMKLLNKYECIENLKLAEEEYGIKPSKQAERSVTDILAEISENNESISSMEERQERLNKQNEEANLQALGIDHKTAAKLASITRELRQLENKRQHLDSQLNAVRSNMPGSDGIVRKDFSALLRFFPDANISALSDVEKFHYQINEFLRSDIEEEIERLEPLIDDINSNIAALEKQLAESGIARSLSQSILTQYAYISREINELSIKNKDLKKEIALIEKRNEAEKLLASLRRKQESALTEAQKEVNEMMETINTIVTDGNRPAPKLVLKPDKTFEFGTVDDKSEGTTFKNLVVYDLSILEMTPLPVLVHDSSIVKRIEDSDFIQILGMYEKSSEKNKQVFIAFDKADSYTPETTKILENSTVLHLAVGEELYGVSWSRRTDEPPPEAEVSENIEE